MNNNFLAKKEFLFFSALFLMTIVAWISVELYHIQKNQSFALEYQTSLDMEIKQIPDPQFIDKLKKKK